MKGTFLAILGCALLVFGIAAPGHAAFVTGDLIQVVYDTATGEEVGTDLGPLSSILSSGGETFTANPVTLTQLGVASFSQLGTIITTEGPDLGATVGGVAYFVVSSSSNIGSSSTYAAVAATAANLANSGTANFSGYKSAATAVMNGYATAAGAGNNQAVVSTSSTTSYWKEMNQNGGTGLIGSYNGWLSTTSGQNAFGGEVVPVDFGSVSQTLYQWVGGGGLAGGTLGTPIGTITTETLEVGNQEVLEAIYTPEATVPLPPSALFMLPGLFGLIGLRRRIRGS